MSCCGDDGSPICPCGQFVHPRVITNPPGRDALAYRPGDYTSFRHALLLARAGETQLSQSDGTQVRPIWRPGATGDLAVQMVEWWAYLAELLSFYNERVANQAYLRTADQPESVNRLIRLLGYRPRPGIGATGVLAALATGPQPFTLPAGFQVQSKPGPGQQPQVFELQADVTITPPIAPPGSSVIQGTASVAPPATASPAPTGSSGTIVLAGTSTAVNAGDRVLILPTPIPPPGSSSATGFAVATVITATPGKDGLGNASTTISLGNMTSSLQGDASQFQLWRSNLSSQVWQYPGDPSYVIMAGQPSQTLQVDLATIVRGLQSGDPIVLEGPGASFPQYGSFTSSTEVVWYANPKGYDPGSPASVSGVNPAIPPPPPDSPANAPPPIAIPIPHTRITFAWPPSVSPSGLTDLPNYLVRYGWKVVGNLVAAPPVFVGGTGAGSSKGAAASGPALTLGLPSLGTVPPPAGTNVLVQDVNGNGALGVVDSATAMHLVDPVPALVPPLQVLFNLLPVSRGKTVSNEVLGSGNSLVAGQDFVLQNAPVTYLQSADSTSGDNYSSTVRVWVNHREWSEVRSFYGQPLDAQVFMTREDDQGQTHVVFGDGQNGARLPTGVNNVVASYRYGSGADVPGAGSLTVVLKPQPGLRAIRNPVPVGGGSDPDPPDSVRQQAPRSVLTFNRAVSLDDFQAIAQQAPGVVRAKAAVAFDPMAQRPRITVWVGDDSSAVAAVQQAFAATADPNRLPRVVQAKAVVMTLNLTVVYDPASDPQTVTDAVHKALVDPDTGLLGVNVIGIGQVVYDSQVYAACLGVPGVVAVHSLQFVVTNRFLFPIFWRYRGRRLPVLELLGDGLAGLVPLPVPLPAPWIWTVPRPYTGPRHDPGQGAYLFLPDDAQHLSIGKEAAS
jgi:hypothetical protein